MICFAFLVVDPGILSVILLFQDVSGWKSRKILRSLYQPSKGVSYLISFLIIAFLSFWPIQSIQGQEGIGVPNESGEAQAVEQIEPQEWRKDYRDGPLSFEQTVLTPTLVYAKAAHIYYDLLPEGIRQKITEEAKRVTTAEYWQNRWGQHSEIEGSDSTGSDGFFSEGYPSIIKAYIDEKIDYLLKKNPLKQKKYIDIGPGDNTSIAIKVYKKYQTEQGIVSKVNTLDPVAPSNLPEGITHIQSLAEDTGLPDNYYDLATVLFTFSYTRREDTLKELSRILRADGSAILILHHPKSATLRHYHLMFYAHSSYLLMLEKIKTAIQSLLVDQEESLSELDKKEFQLQSQFNSDFDLTDPQFLITDPWLFGMIEEHDKHILRIIQTVNERIRVGSANADKINEWWGQVDANSQQRIEAKAYYLKMTQDLHDNVFKKQKDIVEFMRNNGFDFDPLEIHTFLDGEGLPAAYGMVIKNAQSDQAYEERMDYLEYIVRVTSRLIVIMN